MGPQQDVRSRPPAAGHDVSFVRAHGCFSKSFDKLLNSILMGQTFFEQLGGEQKLRVIVNAFIDRVFDDRMIGFFFRKADRERIKAMEYQLAAHFLGAQVEYQGRPLDQVHSKHPIMGGHFARRRQILKETLDLYHVPEPIKEAWLAHTDALRALITSQKDSECDPNTVGRSSKRVNST
jgi:hemoglobin